MHLLIHHSFKCYLLSLPQASSFVAYILEKSSRTLILKADPIICIFIVFKFLTWKDSFVICFSMNLKVIKAFVYVWSDFSESLINQIVFWYCSIRTSYLIPFFMFFPIESTWNDSVGWNYLRVNLLTRHHPTWYYLKLGCD